MTPRELLKELIVLYAEDEPMVMEQMLPTFQRFFRDVKTAVTGDEALEIFLSGNIDVVVTDITMPGINGLELIKRIREKDRKIPVIITTSHDRNDYLKEAIRLYLVDYLVKPFGLDELKKVLEESARQLMEEGRVQEHLAEGVTYDHLRKELSIDGAVQALTFKEQKFLELLLRNKGRLVDREAVEYEVWDGEEMSEAGLKNLLTRLRKKIGKEVIRTVSGSGFILQRTAE